jgi:hypothetical protein
VDERGREHFDQPLRAALVAPQGLQHHAGGVEVLEGVAQRHHMQSRLIAPARWTGMLRWQRRPW